MSTSYEVAFQPRAERELDKVPRDVFLKIDAVIWALRENPRPVGVKKLEGDIHRIRVGDWRIIYAILDQDELVRRRLAARSPRPDRLDQEGRVLILRVVRRTERTYKGLN